MECGTRTGGHGIRLATALLGLMLLASLSGCSLVAGDLADDQVEEIPAALLASDVGVTEAFAEKAVDGFTYYLAVGIYLDDAEFTESDLASVLQIIIDENDLPTDDIELAVRDVDGEAIDLESMMERLVPGVVDTSVYGHVTLTTDGAREIIYAVEARSS